MTILDGDPTTPRDLSSWASSPSSRKVMQGNKSRDTNPELAIRRILHSSGLRYRVDQRPIKEVNRRADIVFRKVRVAVFVDGCFWHGCPRHLVLPRSNDTFWAEKIARNRARDRETNELLRRQGWRVIRVWEHQDPTAAASRIERALRSRGAVFRG
jgi:DNA mismatch endonuclease (patch repair protein)